MNDMKIGERFKLYYEYPFKSVLPMRMPTILRIDGRTFHTFTKDMVKPFDVKFIDIMARLAEYLCKEIHTSQLAYIQSDEISILLHPYKKLSTEAWFGNEIQKIVSVSAGLASSWLTKEMGRLAVFDSRVFVLPEVEVVNYFLWRQQDWEKNSVQMLARSLFTHKELHGKNRKEMVEMIFQKGGNWNKLSTYLKRGICVLKTQSGFIRDVEIPIFSEDREYIHKFLNVEEE